MAKVIGRSEITAVILPLRPILSRCSYLAVRKRNEPATTHPPYYLASRRPVAQSHSRIGVKVVVSVAWRVDNFGD